ncbi:MAG: leucine-rich repeat protein [Clostridia bacterium]|nr:leucine-rich repeat protein [Clostridia bacterium]
MKRQKLLFTLSMVVLLLIAVCIIPAASTEQAEGDPLNLKILGKNLSLEDSVYIYYAVPVEGNNGSDIKMLFWTEPQSEYVYGTQAYELSPEPNTMPVGDQECYVFNFDKLAAKQMTVDVYSRVYATDGNTEYYSPLDKYSVLLYCYNMLGKTSSTVPTEKMTNLLTSLLEYGAAAQDFFGENVDRLANDDYYQIKLEGTTLSDGTNYGLYLEGDEISVTAPETNDEGKSFLYWQNSAEEQVSEDASYTITVGTQNETYTAVYGDKGPVATDDSYFIFTELDDGTYSIKAKDVNNMPAEVVIPATYNGKEVTVIAGSAFSGCKKLIDIILPDSIISINAKAFSGCGALTSITIPNSVTYVFDYAFDECWSLTSIAIPSSVTYISWRAFSYCGFESILSSSPAYPAINNCLIEASTGTLIVGCKNSIIPTDGSVKGIEAYAFSGCIGLANISIPDGVTNIGNYAFIECNTLRSIIISDSVTSIGESAFKFYGELQAVYYTGTAEGWEKISIDDFGNSNLTSATRYYYSQTQPTDTTNKYWHYVDGEPVVWIPYTGTDASYFTFTELSDGTYSIKAKDVNNIPSWVVIPSNYNGKAVTKIASYAFNDCSNLTGITIPTSIMTIGDHAFSQCYYLDSVTFLGSSDWKISSGATVPSSYLTYSKDAAAFIFDYVIETWTRI